MRILFELTHMLTSVCVCVCNLCVYVCDVYVYHVYMWHVIYVSGVCMCGVHGVLCVCGTCV